MVGFSPLNKQGHEWPVKHSFGELIIVVLYLHYSQGSLFKEVYRLEVVGDQLFKLGCVLLSSVKQLFYKADSAECHAEHHTLPKAIGSVLNL